MYALLIGCEYEATPSAALPGCFQDVDTITKLMKPMGYEMDTLSHGSGTRANILAKLNGIGAKALKSSYKRQKFQVFISFSGHGGSVRDTNGDEKDGKDEVIFPEDFEKSGVIIDDEIFAIMRRWPRNVRCVLFFDCCHSGTMSDLPFRYWYDRHPTSSSSTSSSSTSSPSTLPSVQFSIENRNRIGAQCVCISGCDDTQTSASAYDLLGKSTWRGALTTAFSLCLKEMPLSRPSWIQLLKDIRKWLTIRKFTQTAQICFSHTHLANQPCWM